MKTHWVVIRVKTRFMMGYDQKLARGIDQEKILSIYRSCLRMDYFHTLLNYDKYHLRMLLHWQIGHTRNAAGNVSGISKESSANETLPCSCEHRTRAWDTDEVRPDRIMTMFNSDVYEISNSMLKWSYVPPLIRYAYWSLYLWRAWSRDEVGSMKRKKTDGHAQKPRRHEPGLFIAPKLRTLGNV